MANISPLQQDPEYLRRKRQELELSLQPFRDMMYHVLSIMPMQGFHMYPDGRIEQLPIPKEWQEKIDLINKWREDHIKRFWDGIR